MNIVLVKKPNGNWQICIAFIDLNKACPKDLYPLPNINHLVDNAFGFGMLSFRDAFTGYNQWKMHLDDEDKIAFITNEGVYYHRVMLIGLKIAGAIYKG